MVGIDKVKKLLFLLVSFLLVGCDIEGMIINHAVENMDSGTIYRHNNLDCMSLEFDCMELDGIFEYSLDPEDGFACVCYWDNTLSNN